MLSLARRIPELVKFAYDWRLRKTYEKYKDFTMIMPDNYVENLRLARWVGQVRGSIIECGTWRGGMIAGMSDELGRDRQYFLFNSFQGLAPAKEIDDAAALASWFYHRLVEGLYGTPFESEKACVGRILYQELL